MGQTEGLEEIAYVMTQLCQYVVTVMPLLPRGVNFIIDPDFM